MGWSDRGFEKAKALRYDWNLPSGRLDPFALAEQLGIEVVVAPVGKASPVEGMYIRRDNCGFVFVNSSKGYRRQRLTCAHEIGHHVLAEDDTDFQVIEGPSAVSSGGSGREEREAYHFASELLVDERGVREELKDVTDPRDAIARVVAAYDVSPSSAAIRLSELTLIDSPACQRFLAEMEDTAAWQSFMREFDLKTRDLGVHRLKLPRLFVDRARRLRDTGILSEARYDELVSRPNPAVG